MLNILKYNIEGKVTPLQARLWPRGSRGMALIFQDLGSLPPGKTRYPLYRRWVGLRAGLDRCEKSRPHRDSNPRTVQSVASRYIDYATRPTMVIVMYYTYECVRHPVGTVCLNTRSSANGTTVQQLALTLRLLMSYIYIYIDR